MEVAVHAHEVLEPAVSRPEPPGSALGDEPSRGHAPDPGLAVGANPVLERHLLPYQASSGSRAHEPLEHSPVDPQVLDLVFHMVLAWVAHVEQVATALPRQEAPPRRLGEAGGLQEVARQPLAQPEVAARLGPAAEEHELRQGGPATGDPPSRSGGHGAPQQGGHHVWRPVHAQLPPQHPLRDRPELPAHRRGQAQRLQVPLGILEDQHQHPLVDQGRLGPLGRVSRSQPLTGAHPSGWPSQGEPTAAAEMAGNYISPSGFPGGHLLQSH